MQPNNYLYFNNYELMYNASCNVRNKLLAASTKVGIAFSNTKTAAAHSISYPVTIRFGIPHGVASSISLVPFIRNKW